MRGLSGFLWRCLTTVTLAVSVLGALAQAPKVAADKPAAAASAAMKSLPTGKGLPVVVRAALSFQGIEGFDDAKAQFEATTSLRLRGEDARLRFEAARPDEVRLYRSDAVDEALAGMWSPPIRFVGRIGEPTMLERVLRVQPDGTAELVVRSTAVYNTPVDVTSFPFDRQRLQVQVAMRHHPADEVDLDFSNEDVEYSKAAAEAEVGGWRVGLVHLRRHLVQEAEGERFVQFVAALDVQRSALATIATIFIPLFASLPIPFLATWMNRSDDGEFAVDAFELANVIIGGLFAVIALSFSISASYPAVAASDNTVTRLIGLNYLALAMGLIIAVVFYRYDLPRQWFGPTVQHQAFKYLTWAFPFLFVSTGLIFLALAAV